MSEQEEEYKHHDLDWDDVELCDVDEKKVEVTVACKNCDKAFMIDYVADYAWYMNKEPPFDWKPFDDFIEDEECKPE